MARKLGIMAVLAACLLQAGVGHAATILLTTGISVHDPVNNAGGGTTNNKTVDTAASGQSAVSANATDAYAYVSEQGYPQSNAGTATASVDIATGTMRARVDQTYEGFLGQGTAYGGAIAEVYETFTAVGTGTITFQMQIDGNYSAHTKDTPNQIDGSLEPAPTASVQLSGSVLLGVGENNAVNTDDPGAACAAASCTSLSGTINQLLSQSMDVADGKIVTLYARLVAQMMGTEGVLDFGHTGLLSLTTTPGLTLIAGDPLFLSSPAFAATPIPAALPLFGTALAGLGFAARRRSQKSPSAA